MENATKIGISVEKSSDSIDRRLSVAPMMDWTDRHCRFFLRGFSPRVLLYTEMIHANAILRGDRERLLRFHPEEHPVALQLGGSDPTLLAAAARAGEEAGYDEINLNCGCPSDRVRAGAFGACLMAEPALVADCVAAMRAAVRVPVTVKTRIGIVAAACAAHAASDTMRFDDSDRAALHAFVAPMRAAGADALIVHARKAVLGGLSPKANRDIPPLRMDVVQDLVAAFPGCPVVVNGGLRTAEQAFPQLAWASGVMLGREAYHRPYVLAELDRLVYGGSQPLPERAALLERMATYAEREIAAGERMSAITRHMLGLFSREPAAREYRRLLSEGARAAEAGPELLRRVQRGCV